MPPLMRLNALPPLFDDEQTPALPGGLPPLFDDEPAASAPEILEPVPKVMTSAPVALEPQALPAPKPLSGVLPPLFDDQLPVRKPADDDGQRHGWGWLDTAQQLGAIPEAWENMLPGLNPGVVTAYEAAPNPTSGGMFGKAADFASDITSGLGTGAIGMLLGGPAGMGVAGGVDQLGRNLEEKRIAGIKSRFMADPEITKEDADIKSHAAGEQSLDAGDWGDAALAGVFNMFGGKLAQKTMTKAAKQVFDGVKTPAKAMLQAIAPQIGYDVATGAAQGISSELNQQNATMDTAAHILSSPETYKNAAKAGAISAAISAGGQGIGLKGDIGRIRSAGDLGVRSRAIDKALADTKIEAESARDRVKSELMRQGLTESEAAPLADAEFESVLSRPLPAELQGGAAEAIAAKEMFNTEPPSGPSAASRLLGAATDAAGAAKASGRELLYKTGQSIKGALEIDPELDAMPIGDIDTPRPGVARAPVAKPAAPTPAAAPAAAPAPDLAAREVVTRPDGSIQRVKGNQGLYAHPNETVERNPIQVRYELRELDDIRASHDPESGFAPNLNYPQQIQNRFYDSDLNEQDKVKSAARILSPSKLINKSQGADDGPPIIDADGNVLSGNGRTQVLIEARAAHPENFAGYKSRLEQDAAEFGFAPEDVQGMKNPVLVRVTDVGEDPDFAKRALFGAKANDRVNQAQSPADVGSTLATSGKIPKEMVEALMESVEGDRLGEALSNRDFIYPFRDSIAAALPREVGAMFDTSSGDLKLNNNGKSIVKSMLMHHAVGDRALTKYVTTEESGLSGKLESALLPILKSHDNAADGWALGDDIKTALRIISENPKARTAEEVISGSTSDFVRGQEIAEGLSSMNDKTRALIELMKSPKKTALREALIEFNNVAHNQDGMFADADVTPGDTLMGLARKITAEAPPPAKAPGAGAAEANAGKVVLEDMSRAPEPSEADALNPDSPDILMDTTSVKDDRVSITGRPRRQSHTKGSDFALAKKYNRALAKGEPGAEAMGAELVSRKVQVTPGSPVDEAEIGRLLAKKNDLPKQGQLPPREGFHSKTPGAADITIGGSYTGTKTQAQPMAMPEVVSLFKEILGDVPSIVKGLKSRGAVSVPRGHAKNMDGVEAFINATISGDVLEATRTLAHELFHVLDYMGGHAHTMSRGGVARRMLSDSKTVLNAIGELKYKFQRIDPRFGEKKLRAELWELSKVMRPFDEATAPAAEIKYRKEARELYADFGSALLMNPKLAKELAPKSVDAFFRYLEEKPKALRAFSNMMELLNKPAESLNDARIEGLIGGFHRGRDERTKMTEKIKADREGDTSLKGNLTKWFHDSHHDLNQFVEKHLGVMKNTKEWASYKNAKDKSQGWGNKDSIMLGELERTVDTRLKSHDLSVDDLGTLMTLQHITETRFRKSQDGSALEALFNPNGIDEASARQMLSRLKSRLGKDRFQELSRAAGDARDIIFNKSIEEAYHSGILSDEQYKTYHDRKDSYSRFSVIDYITESIGADLKHQVGTLREIENPYVASALQGAALIRWVQQNNFRRAVAEPALAGGWKAAKRRVLTEPPQEGQKPVIKTVFDQPPPGEGAVLEFWKDGEKHGVILPTYATTHLQNLKTDQAVSGALSALAAANKPFRAMFTKYAPVFNYLTSWYRDIPESVRSLNAAGVDVGRIEFTRLMLKELKGEMTWKEFAKAMTLMDADVSKSSPLLHAKGGMNAEIERALNDAILLPVNDSVFWSDGSYNVSDSVITRFAETHGFVEPPKATALQKIRQQADGIRLLRATLNTVERLPQIGEALNTAQKMAGQKALVKGGIDRNLASQMARDFIGNPNTKTKGAMTGILDQVFLYTNVIEKSIARNFEAMRKNPKAFAAGLMKTGVAAAAVQSIAAAGFMGDAMQDWVQGIPEFDRSNYNCIPVYPFVSIDDHGRKQSHYIRLPMDDISRITHGLVWKSFHAVITKAQGGDVDAGDFLTGAFAFGESLTPGMSPIIKIPVAAVELMTGQNPYDAYRGGSAIDKDVFEAGGSEKYKQAFLWMLQQTGANNFIKFNGGVPSIAGFDRIYRVSGRGWDEAEYNVMQPERREAAQKRVSRKAVWAEYLKSGDPSVIDTAESEGRITDKQAASLRKAVAQTPIERKAQGLSKEAREKAMTRAASVLGKGAESP